MSTGNRDILHQIMFSEFFSFSLSCLHCVSCYEAMHVLKIGLASIGLCWKQNAQAIFQNIPWSSHNIHTEVFSKRYSHLIMYYKRERPESRIEVYNQHFKFCFPQTKIEDLWLPGKVTPPPSESRLHRTGFSDRFRRNSGKNATVISQCHFHLNEGQ